MAPNLFYENSNISNIALTPRDYQVEILSSANERNIITSLSQNSTKEFCALKLIQQLAHQLRRTNNRKISLFITSSPYAYNLIHYLTDLKVINLNDEENEDIVWDNIHENQVIIFQIEMCLFALDEELIDINDVNLLIIDDCHQSNRIPQISEIFHNHYRKAKEKPKIFGLAGPLHNAQCSPARLGAEMEYLESLMCAKVETASDIVTVLRYSSKPIEIIVECASPADNDIICYIRQQLIQEKNALMDHRYDPSEIYSDFKDELANIPDPKEEPLKVIEEFLLILNELGVYCADKAAFILLMHIEKLKIKTPHERHYLLLCQVSTLLTKIRAFIDSAFHDEENSEKEKIEKYSTPKIQRLLEVLKIFKPEMKQNNGPTNRSQNHRKEKEKEKPVDECESPRCLELISELNIENINTLETETSEKIKKISEDLENVKASVAKITSSSPSKQNNHRYNRFRGKKGRRFFHRPRYHHNQNEQEALCGLIFCESIVTAKTLFGLLCEVSRHDPDLKFLNVQYTVNKTADPVREPKECELEHRKQEEVLKKFRMHECNLLITTAILEEGFDLPKCNLVLRWNTPRTYRSYVQCKGRAKTANALHVIMINPEFKIQSFDIDNIADRNHKMICDSSRESFEEFFDCDSDSEPSSSAGTITEIENCVVEKVDELVRNDELYEEVEESSKQMIDKMAEYMEIEKMLIKHCENKEPHPSEIAHADKFTNLIQSYQPGPNSPQVTLATSIALLNKYCAKLPSDTFTKLTPIWRCSKSIRNGKEMFQYSLRLPLNSPMKNDIVGLPMPTRTLARRVACLIACRLLHKSGELDDNLSPIGKEGFKAIEPDWQFFDLDEEDEKVAGDENEPRPGTTKRRQYYYKRIASVFSNCRPTTEVTAYLYHITMVLQCPIPEEQNTRGRKIYPPEDAIQSFGILTTKRIPHISAFPIFTRSGEVKVSLELIKKGVTLNENQLNKINHFINYTFTNVLRLRKNLMLFDPEAVENSFFVVPVTRESGDIEIDWIFLTAIQHSAQTTSSNVNGKDRTVKPFDYNEFKDAVVMPWYRNLDQPQYFYVAEICSKLSPESDFPGDNYKTFDEYYFKKYNIEIKNKNQPLLDVDHTSARLNFLTPRYVNRKGVALPTSSEETKRAKRENLEQKQILVPELCTVHPFPASLWRAAVCLPCVLYRINALLLADEIRMTVSNDIGLGSLEIVDESFKWPMLDFGWTLADVLLKTREAKLKEEEESKLEEEKAKKEENAEKPKDEGKSEEKDDEENPEKSANDKLEEANDEAKWLDIGMWSNEMAKHVPDDFDDDGLLPDNLELCSSNRIRYGSPTSWEGTCEPRISKHNINSKKTTVANFYPSDSEFDSDEDPEDLPDFEEDDALGLNIEFKNDHLAEAVETEEEIERQQRKLEYLKESIAIEKYYEMMKNTTKGFDFIDEDNYSELEDKILIHEENFKKSITEAKALIRSNGVLVPRNDKIPQKIRQSIKNESENTNGHDIEISELIPYADKNEIVNYLENDGQLSLDDLYEINAKYEERHPDEKFEIIGSGDLFDNFGDVDNLTVTDDCRKLVKLKIKNDYENFKKPAPESLDDKLKRIMNPVDVQLGLTKSKFSFDYQPNLKNHPGPSPSVILQALTMSNANDGINLERLETIGDSFLKYSITTYLYCTYESVNEGKLSYLRSKQVSNLNLYRLGRRKILGEFMIATKFEPHDNWLAPCYFVPKGLEQDLIDAKIPVRHWNLADLLDIKKLSSEEICKLLRERVDKLEKQDDNTGESEDATTESKQVSKKFPKIFNDGDELENYSCSIPYNLVTQHSIPDKSIADCVEALIGAYLIECGTRGALLFMAWLGIRVLPFVKVPALDERVPGSTKPSDEQKTQILYGHWIPPQSPLLRCVPEPERLMMRLLDGFDKFEEELDYHFKDKSYLLQAMTHASYSPNRLTDCYQRLEFLGDAVLDYLITRHLYEDPRQHSPGALTDLRSALVNNTIFASLAVRHNFHKYFLHQSPPLNEVIARFVRIQHENGHNICEEYYLLNEEEADAAEDVEVPKALGDVFESIAGAIFLDSGMSLDAVWRVYYKMMGTEIEKFSCSVPKSPIRELLELEPETAKFGKPEKLACGRRVRVTVEVFGKGVFRGIGRNYRIAKCTAAKCALRNLKKNNMLNKKH